MTSVSRWVLVFYCIYLLLPLYWLMTMALRSNSDITGKFEVCLLYTSPSPRD